jgi:hypothetical protein
MACAAAAVIVAKSDGDGQSCAPPEDPLVCQVAESRGISLATCERDPQTGSPLSGGVYASPNDQCDDWSGITAAVTRARGRGVVELPPGERSLPGFTASPYLVSQPVNITAVHVRGTRAGGPHQGTRIAPMPGASFVSGQGCYDLPLVDLPTVAQDCRGAVLWASSGFMQLQDVVVQADASNMNEQTGEADAAIYLYKTHGANITGVTVQGGRRAGIHSEYAMVMRWDGVTARYSSGVGVMIVGANGGSFRRVSATVNDGTGVVITTRPQASGHATGEFFAESLNLEQNGGHGVHVLRAYGSASLSALRAEGNALDGVRIEEAQNIHLYDFRVISPPSDPHPIEPGELAWHGVSLVRSPNALVERGVLSGREDVWIEGPSRFTVVRGVLYWGSAQAGPLEYAGAGVAAEVRHYYENQGVWVERQHQRTRWSNGQPPAFVDSFRAGDVVRAAMPSVAGPNEWRCRATPLYGGTCSAWSQQ